MSTAFYIGFIVGILIVAIVSLISIKRKCRGQYDERQKAIQGVAYKFGFFAMFAYFIINGFICMEIGEWLPIIDMNFIGLCFGIVCFAGYAIFNDAYLSLNSKPFKFSLFISFVAIINYVCFFINVMDGDTPEAFLLNLICAVFLTVICFMIIIKVIIDKHNEKKELVEE
ncbi:MAG TPA: hypothetical protein DD413_06660 [Ruminococcus sp.]|nr:hypothetical protein [Ruminococcus sp.]